MSDTEIVEDSEPERQQHQPLQRPQKHKKKASKLSSIPSIAAPSGIRYAKPRRELPRGPVIEISDDSEPESFMKQDNCPRAFSPDFFTTLQSEEPPSVDCSHLAPRTVESPGPFSANHGIIPPKSPHTISSNSGGEGILKATDFANKARPLEGSTPDSLTSLQVDSQVISSTNYRKGSSAMPRDLRTLSSDSENEDNQKPMKIKQFSYKLPPKIVVRNFSTSSSSQSSSAPCTSNVLEKPSKAKRPKATSHSFTSDFPDVELGKLLKCVSCELSWTTRKTVLQKMKHIQTCGKKKGLTHDTIVHLIRKELPSPPVAEPEPPAVPITLLEDVLNGAAPKRRGKRPEVVETVRNVAESRQDILQRAKHLLESSSSDTKVQSSCQHAPSAPTPTNEAPPLTQPFGESSLAARFRLKPPLIATSNTQAWIPSPDTSMEPNIEETQPFGQSALALKFHKSALDSAQFYISEDETSPKSKEPNFPTHFSSFDTTHSLKQDVILPTNPSQSDDPIYVWDLSPAKVCEPPALDKQILDSNPAFDSRLSPISLDSTCNSESEPGPMHHSRGINNLSSSLSSGSRKKSLELIADDRRLQHQSSSTRSPRADSSLEYPTSEDSLNGDNGAYLHFEPDLYSNDSSYNSPLLNLSTRPLNSPPKTPQSTPTHILLHSLTPPPALPTTLQAGPELPPVKPKKTRKKKSPKEALEEMSLPAVADELHSKLMGAILSDTALYLRILRFEPLHLNVFLKLAIDLGVPPRGREIRVKAFLDSKAIHYHVKDLGESRTRKRHR